MAASCSQDEAGAATDGWSAGDRGSDARQFKALEIDIQTLSTIRSDMALQFRSATFRQAKFEHRRLIRL